MAYSDSDRPVPSDSAPAIWRRRDFVRLVAHRTGLRQTDVSGVLSVISDLAVERLHDRGSCEVPGICRLSLERRSPQRRYLNGGVRELPERQVIKAKPARRIREVFFSNWD